MNKKVLCIGLTILIISFLVGCSKTTEQNEVAAIVNGEKIYCEEIKNVLHNDETLTYDTVLQNTINDLLIIQYGKKSGIDVFTDEVESRFNEIVALSPTIMKKIEGIGVEQYKKILKNVILLEKSKEFYLSQFKSELLVTDEEIDEWYKENINGEYIQSSSVRESIKDAIYDKKEDKLLKKLIEDLKGKANIIIYGE